MMFISEKDHSLNVCVVLSPMFIKISKSHPGF